MNFLRWTKEIIDRELIFVMSLALELSSLFFSVPLISPLSFSLLWQIVKKSRSSFYQRCESTRKDEFQKSVYSIIFHSPQSMYVFSQYPRTALERKSKHILYLQRVTMGRSILEGKILFCVIDYWLQEIFIFVFLFIKRKLFVSLRSIRRQSCGPGIPSALPTPNTVGFTQIPHCAVPVTHVLRAEDRRFIQCTSPTQGHNHQEMGGVFTGGGKECLVFRYPCLPSRGFPDGSSSKEPACQCKRHKRRGFNPWVGKIL